MKKRLSVIWYLSIIFIFVLLIYITFGKSLNFPLWGDDWFMLWIVKNFYGPGKEFSYISLKSYSQPWGVMNLVLIINKHFFGYSGFGYYLVSMTLRTLSAFAGYLFLSRFLKSKFIGLIGSLFVLVGYTGIESTNYTIHMNTYLVLLFIFLTLICLINSRKNKIGIFLLGCLFFAISLAVSPLRSHGLLPFVVIFDVIYGLTIFKINLKQVLFRQVGLILSFLVILKLGFFGVPTSSFINITQILKMIGNGDYTFVSCFITNLGRTYFPDIYSINVNSVIRIVGFNWFKTVTLLAFVIETLVFWYLTKITHQRIKNYIVVVLILIFNFSLTIFIFIKSSQNSGLFPILISTFIGLFFLSFLFWALHVLFLSKKEKATPEWVGMIAGPVLVLTSLMVPLLTYPGAIYDSNHRYLTLSLVGVAITYASLLKLSVNNKKMSLFVLTFLLLLIFVNIKADRRYFSTLHINRNPIIAMSEWNQFTSYMGKYYQKYPDKLLLFYFDDSESGGIAASTFFYGFNLRVALENNIKDRNRVPAYTTVYAEAVSAVTDGKAFLRLGYPEEKIGIDQVYAFKVDKNGDLIDITQQTRKDLINEQKLLAK